MRPGYAEEHEYDTDEPRRARPLFEADDVPAIGAKLRTQHARGVFRSRLTAQVKAAGVEPAARRRAYGCPRFAPSARWDDEVAMEDSEYLPF